MINHHEWLRPDLYQTATHHRAFPTRALFTQDTLGRYLSQIMFINYDSKVKSNQHIHL